jgi:diguanylate cyclase (GGDEF)-like protein
MPHIDDDFSDTTVEVTITRDLTVQRRFAAAHQACLVVISGPRLGQRTQLGKNTLHIGRGNSCDLMLDMDSVSRQHARIEWNGVAHKFVDLASTNGSFVNEARVGEQALKDGDRIQVGKALLKYISGSNIENSYHEEIQRLMRYDGLTGVYNKRYFEDALELELTAARTKDKPVGLILFDLDHFKRVNDTWGHAAGDAVLRQVSEVVAGLLGSEQVFGRVGGEEFAVLWSGAADTSVVRSLAEGLRRAVESTEFGFEGTRIDTTISLGVALRRPGTAESPQSLYKRADERLYEAKASGRNCVR